MLSRSMCHQLLRICLRKKNVSTILIELQNWTNIKIISIILVKIKCIWITDWRFANRHLLKLEHGQSSTHKFINPPCQQPPSAVTPQIFNFASSSLECC
ncbi:hypothetical protein L1887_32067 [Cichorium endivia]|nr:hypothetical protein L1887_32067 [Cichorium endivia]